MKVKAKHHFKHKDKDVRQGDVFDAPDHEASQLIQQGHVEKHEDDDPEGGARTGSAGSTGTPGTGSKQT